MSNLLFVVNLIFKQLTTSAEHWRSNLLFVVNEPGAIKAPRFD